MPINANKSKTVALSLITPSQQKAIDKALHQLTKPVAYYIL